MVTLTRIKLKNCPFCGRNAFLRREENEYFAECNTCHVKSQPRQDMEDAIYCWNWRIGNTEEN